MTDNCHKSCTACHHKHFSEQESCKKKEEFLRKKLHRWNEVLSVIRTVSGEKRFHYRRKVCLHANYNGSRWEFGLLIRKNFIAIPNCPIHSPEINRVGEILSGVLPGFELFPMKYFVQSGRQVMLVLKDSVLPYEKWLTEDIKQTLSAAGVEGFWLHLNPSAGNRIFMKHNFYLLYGKELSQDEQGMYYGPMSFQQQIPTLYLDSLQEAKKFLEPNDDAVVVDLYSGIGYSLKEWVATGAEAIGVELNGEAIQCCSKNVPKSTVLRGKCSDRLPQLNDFIVNSKKKKRLLYMNPPRVGVEKEVLQWIKDVYVPSHIAYLSCSPGTLARDIEVLCEAGYKVVKMIPYDFFPLTMHVECLALLSKD